MFKSERLVRITIQVPEPFISAATGILSRFKLLHLIRIEETHLGRLGYVAETDGELLKEFEDHFVALQRLLETLQVPPDGVPVDEEVIPEKEVFKIRLRLESIREQTTSALGDLEGIDRTLEVRRVLLDRLKLLPTDLDIPRLSRCVFVHWSVGLLPARALEKLEESLREVHHTVVEIGAVQDRVVLLVFGLRREWPVFERALKGALFEIIEIPQGMGISQTPAESLPIIEAEITELEARGKSLARERETLRHRFGAELLLLREKVIASRRILSARRFFGKIDKTFLISGWIPQQLFPALEENLRRVTEGQVVMEKVDPEDIREVREGIVKIPILFNNPLLISPFEKLTGLYGTPRYREVEPTIFFALSFLLLFGMMFGDVGQGGVLFLLGYLIFRRFYKSMDYGIILMECGLSSTLFGFLYGTVFGLETVLPALWLRPMDNIPYFVKTALVVGVALVSLGLALNLLNAWRLKEYEKLPGAGGAAGALLYWMTAGLALKYLFTGRVAPWEWNLLGWAAAGLITLMVLHRPVTRLLSRRLHPERETRHAEPATELMESIVEVFDELLRFAANTASFIRVAAFALSHAALFMAVFSIADVVSREKGTGLSYWLVVAVGNVVIILLEGLVVSIQTVRLEYYEFFGRFFRGGGERFEPFDRATGLKENRGEKKT